MKWLGLHQCFSHPDDFVPKWVSRKRKSIHPCGTAPQLAVEVHDRITMNWVCPAKPFPSACNPPPQQGPAGGRSQQSQTLQRHTASLCRRSVLQPSEAEVPQKQLHLMSWPDSRRSPCVIPGIMRAANLPQVRGSALKLFSHQLFRCFSENPPNRPSPVKPT